jgi:RNA polymerase sigma-70 factor (sigma-E family)
MTSYLGGALPRRIRLQDRLSARLGGWFQARLQSRATGPELAAGSPLDLPFGAPAADDPTPTATVAELYRDRRLGLVRLAVLLVDDLPTAEDVVQDAFAAVYRRHGPVLQDVGNAGAYLSTAVVNTARTVLRRRRFARAVPFRRSTGPAVEEGLLLAEEHREVLDALAKLTPRQREVLVLRYWSELSEAQIADALGLSRGTVKSTASRALDALEKRLKDPR